jgi:hypothetical protein
MGDRTHHSTISGRTTRKNYIDETPLEDIIDISIPGEKDELDNHNREKDLSIIPDLIKKYGFEAVLDECLREMENSENVIQKTISNWFTSNGLLKLLRACTSHPKFIFSDQLKDEFCQITTSIFEEEMVKLTKSSFLKQKMEKATLEGMLAFSFDTLWSRLKETAPRLTSMFGNLIIGGYTKVKKSGQSMQRTQREEVEENEWNDVDTDFAAESEDEGDDDVSAPAPLGAPQTSSLSKRQQLILTNSVSTFCYARNRRVNLFQVQMGCYLAATRAGKRVINVYRQLGNVVGYTSVNTLVKAIAISSKHAICRFISQYPSFLGSIDNIDYTSRVGDERRNHRAVTRNCTSGFLFINPLSTTIDRMFDSSAVQFSEIASLTAVDFEPTESEDKFLKKVFCGIVYDTLNQYFPCLHEFRNQDELRLPPFIIPEIFQIKLQKTIMYALKTFNWDEGTITEMTEVLRELEKEMGLSNTILSDKKLFLSGDQKTCQNARYELF